jgi:agmatine deiminase
MNMSELRKIPRATPKEAGFFMPAEWEKQEAVWLSWPQSEDTFPDLFAVQKTYKNIIRSICPYQTVHLCVRDEETEVAVRQHLQGEKFPAGALKFHHIDYADVWFRDYGPTFVVNREHHELAMVDWQFNAWGNKYPQLLPDDGIPLALNQDLSLRAFYPRMVLEGGSIDVNGKGTIMTTEQCLLNRNRNPEMNRTEIEMLLCEYLGCSHVIWLKGGIAGDDTDGHVDDVARFVDERTVVCSLEQDPSEENYAELRENYRILKSATDQHGNTLRVIPLPMPGRLGDTCRLPASYANFLITNQTVIMPEFEHPHDGIARMILEAIFPGREIIGIDCRALVGGLGAVHCISQQQPVP